MLANSHEERLKRAYTALVGLSVGDAFGAFFEFNNALVEKIRTRTLFKAPWRYTDDTNMALSIFAVLRRFQEINQDALAAHFAKYYDRSRGYGMSTRSLMVKIRQGDHWKIAASNVFAGQGSYGNGGAMQVAPIGAYFADDMGLVIEHGRRSAEVTHAHPEGIAGTIATATAAAYMWLLRDSPNPNRDTFFAKVLEHVPDSEVKQKIYKASELESGISITRAVKALGNGHNVSAQDTVPIALWCAAQHFDSFEEALWLTVSALGDADTTCAIVGGIVAGYTSEEGIPTTWLERREPLPQWVFEDETL